MTNSKEQEGLEILARFFYSKKPYLKDFDVYNLEWDELQPIQKEGWINEARQALSLTYPCQTCGEVGNSKQLYDCGVGYQSIGKPQGCDIGICSQCVNGLKRKCSVCNGTGQSNIPVIMLVDKEGKQFAADSLVVTALKEQLEKAEQKHLAFVEASKELTGENVKLNAEIARLKAELEAFREFRTIEEL